MKYLLSTVLFILTATIASISWAADIVHDAEYYILEAQNGDKWAIEDEGLNARLAALREKHGRPPNLIHVMWDDTSFGDVGIPAISKVRGFETPSIRTQESQMVALRPQATKRIQRACWQKQYRRHHGPKEFCPRRDRRRPCWR